MREREREREKEKAEQVWLHHTGEDNGSQAESILEFLEFLPVVIIHCDILIQ